MAWPVFQVDVTHSGRLARKMHRPHDIGLERRGRTTGANGAESHGDTTDADYGRLRVVIWSRERLSHPGRSARDTRNTIENLNPKLQIPHNTKTQNPKLTRLSQPAKIPHAFRDASDMYPAYHGRWPVRSRFGKFERD